MQHAPLRVDDKWPDESGRRGIIVRIEVIKLRRIICNAQERKLSRSRDLRSCAKDSHSGFSHFPMQDFPREGYESAPSPGSA